MPNAKEAASSTPPRAVPRRGLPTLAMLAAVALFVMAGHWQQGRMREKEVLRAQLDAATNALPVPLAALPAASDWSTYRYRGIVATATAGGSHRYHSTSEHRKATRATGPGHQGSSSRIRKRIMPSRIGRRTNERSRRMRTLFLAKTFCKGTQARNQKEPVVTR